MFVGGMIRAYHHYKYLLPEAKLTDAAAPATAPARSLVACACYDVYWFTIDPYQLTRQGMR